jgi:FkbM family methyltransferase
MAKLDYVNNVLNKIGFNLERFNPRNNTALRRNILFNRLNITLLIDVGANAGYYGKEIRKAGYKNKIISFEPIKNAFDVLLINTKKFKQWEAYNLALGVEDTQTEINISENSCSSSILNILDTHTNAEKSASYIGKQNITIKTLDSFIDTLSFKTHKEIYLKIDTQGFELEVLKGATKALTYINTIQLEMSLEPLYAQQALYNEVFTFLWQHGYTLIDIEPGFTDKHTGKLLQIDGIFRKTNINNTIS